MKRTALLIACTLALSGCNANKHTQAEEEAALKAEQKRMRSEFCSGLPIGRMTIPEFKDCEKELSHD